MVDKATNFFAWMDEQYARPSLDEETMAEHDKHYHKGGYNPETDRCEKRDKEKDTDSNNSSLPPFTEKMLLDRFGMKVQPFDIDMDGEEAKKFTTESFREEWNWYAVKPEEKNRKHTISLVGNVLADIENRFRCKLNVDNLLIAEFRPYQGDYGICGASLADRISVEESMMAIATNIPTWDRETFGHIDINRYKQDIVRHELGHTLSTTQIRNEFKDICKGIETKYGSSALGAMLNTLSSRYALKSQNDLEYIAEIFSRLTAPEYKHSILGAPFEMLVRRMLGGVQ